MPKTIRDPLSWSAWALRDAGRAIGAVADHIGGLTAATTAPPPVIRHIRLEDLASALRAGVDDFTHFRSDAVFLILIYPLIGVGLVMLSARQGAPAADLPHHLWFRPGRTGGGGRPLRDEPAARGGQEAAGSARSPWSRRRPSGRSSCSGSCCS
jgi:hypothetical protein